MEGCHHFLLAKVLTSPYFMFAFAAAFTIRKITKATMMKVSRELKKSPMPKGPDMYVFFMLVPLGRA